MPAGRLAGTFVPPRSTGDLFSHCSTVGLAAGGHAKWTDTADNNFSANLVVGNDGSQVETHNATEVMVFDGPVRDTISLQ